jgi:UDP-N-acetyl-D-mannosaminuronate dehydrogenase
VFDIVKALKEYDLNITVHDPWANPDIAMHEYGIEVVNILPEKKFDTVVLAVAHAKLKSIDIKKLIKKKSVVYDVKGFYDSRLVDGRL